MIFRLEYKNKALKTARVDIITPTGTGVETVEGTGYPFMLKYEGDKKNKGLMFLSSSAEINIYETPLFNIDTLKTSGEKDIRVNYYIDSALEWTGFVIPDFFSREIGGDGVVSMVASDRLAVLDSEVLEGLPVTVTLRTLLSSSLAKTGLVLPLKTVVDFATVSGNTAALLNHSIRSQRLTDTKGRSVNCKDIIKSILVATNSKLMQRKGEWWVVNKMQHELGGGRVYTSPTAFTGYVEDLISFTDVTRGAMRTIAPVAGGVGVFQEYGGGKLIPDNYNFKNGLTGWTNYNGFVSSTNNRRVLGYTQSGSIFTPIYDDAGTSESYLVNRNISPLWVLYSTPMLSLFDPYAIRSTRIVSPVVSGDSSSAKAAVEINAVGRNGTYLPFSVVLKRPGRKNLFLSRNNEWQTREVAQLLSFKNEGADNLAAVSAGMSVSVVISAESSGEVLDDVGTYTIEVLIFGSGLQGDNTVDNTTLINSASVQFSAASNDTPKGTLYKADQGGESYTKIHDTETTVFGDYLTGGLNGYFYNYAPDDTSSLLAPNGSRSQPAWVNTYTQNTEPLPLLQQTIRQMRRMFSVAHDFIKGEIDVSDFDPLSIFEDCERRFVIVEAEFDFLRGSLQVVLEEVAYQNLTVREYIYSYFGEGDEGIRGISGISAGSSGGGGGGGMAPEPSWLENEITIDTESGLLSVDGWHVKGNLILEGQVNQWLAQQLVVDDARIQVNRRQGGATVDSGLVIHDRDTGLEVSSLVYDVDGIWRTGGQRIFTDDYNPMLGGLPAADYATKSWVENSATAYNAARLGGYVAASYPRKAEAAVITQPWTFDNSSLNSHIKLNRGTGRASITMTNLQELLLSASAAASIANGITITPDGLTGLGIRPTERLHVNGNGLFTGSLTAVNASLSGTLGVTGNVTAGAQLSSPTYVSGFAGSGWRIDGGAETHLTIDRLTVRGRMDVYEMVINQIRATNGSLWVSDGEKVNTASKHSNPDEYRIFPDTDNGKKPLKFQLNDIIRAQKWDGRNIIFITARVGYLHSNGYNIKTDGFGGWRGDPSELVGLEFVRIGNTSNTDRQGALYLTSSDSNAPYMDVLDGVNSASFAGKTRVRIGRLDGITDPDLGALTGYGLYTENGYFKGKIQVTGGNAATKADVDAVQVGGRNLILNSNFSNGTKHWGTQGDNSITLTGDGIECEIGDSASLHPRQNITLSISPNESLVSTVIMKIEVGDEGVIRAQFLGTSNIVFTPVERVEIGDGWYKLIGIYTNGPIARTVSSIFGMHGFSNGDKFSIKSFKVELGNRATDWTPAPEDVDAKIADTKLYIEYSTDGTSWHTTFQSNDVYMRQKTGVNGTWTGAIKIVGKDGTSVSIKGRVATSASLPSSANLGDGYIAEDTGHLWVWTGSWTDAGQIRGDNGANSYIHVAYADDSQGGGFSHNPAGKSWIGTYADFTATDSDTPSDYTWMYAKGQQGEPGISVSGTDVEFAQSTSATIAPTTGWQTTAPEWIDGQYIWTRTKTTYSSGNPTYSEAVNLTGAKGSTGSTGAAGTGVSSITEQYYLSTSKTTQTGGSWVESPPAWEAGKYMWTRVQIVYENPTSTDYTDPIVSAEWDAIDTLKNRVETTLGLADLENINETLITGGKVRTSLLEATAIAAAVVTAENVEGLTLNFDKGTIGGWTLDTQLFYSGSWQPNLLVGSGIKLDAANSSIIAQSSSPAHSVEMFYRSSSEWGLVGKRNNAAVFQLGSTNQIDGFEFGGKALAHVAGGSFVAMNNHPTAAATAGGLDSKIYRGFGIYHNDTEIDGAANAFRAIRIGHLATPADDIPDGQSGIQITRRINNVDKDVFRIDGDRAFIASVNFSDSEMWGSFPNTTPSFEDSPARLRLSSLGQGDREQPFVEVGLRSGRWSHMGRFGVANVEKNSDGVHRPLTQLTSNGVRCNYYSQNYLTSTTTYTEMQNNRIRVVYAGSSRFEAYYNNNVLQLFARDLPTNASGLASGQVWRDATGVLRIV